MLAVNIDTRNFVCFFNPIAGMKKPVEHVETWIVLGWKISPKGDAVKDNQQSAAPAFESSTENLLNGTQTLRNKQGKTLKYTVLSSCI